MADPAASATIDDYIAKLDRELGAMDAVERSAIFDEIADHLRSAATDSDAAMASAIARLGTPHDLARRYRDELAEIGALERASPLARVALVLGSSGRSVGATAAALAAFLSYLGGIGNAAVAIAKPIWPSHVGAWTAQGMLRSYGIVGNPPSHATEQLGYAIIPLALVLAAAFWLLGRQLARLAGRILVRAIQHRPGAATG